MNKIVELLTGIQLPVYVDHWSTAWASITFVVAGHFSCGEDDVSCDDDDAILVKGTIVGTIR